MPEVASAEKTSTTHRKNFQLGVAQGVFVKAGSSFVQATTILPTFLYALVGSHALCGLILTIQKLGQTVPQIWAARYLNSIPYKKPVLIGVAGLRGACWAGIGVTALLWGWGTSYPYLVLFVFFLGLILFYTIGGIGLIAFNDFTAKVIDRNERGTYFGWRGFLGGGAAVLTALVARWVLSLPDLIPHPTEHSLLFFLAALFFATQILFLLPMEEPLTHTPPQQEPLKGHLKDLNRILTSYPWLRTLCYTKLLLGGALLAIPYYVIFATEQLGQPLVAVGTYTVLVVLAKMVGGLFWGKLADRYGHKRVLILVGFVSLLPYLLAYLSSIVHPLLMYGVFFSLGLSLDSKEVLVRNYLLDRSPKDSVPTFSALLNTMSAPTMVFPLLGALVISLASYKALFIVALAVTAGGVSAAFRLPEMLDEGIELIQT